MRRRAKKAELSSSCIVTTSWPLSAFILLLLLCHLHLLMLFLQIILSPLDLPLLISRYHAVSLPSFRLRFAQRTRASLPTVVSRQTLASPLTESEASRNYKAKERKKCTEHKNTKLYGNKKALSLSFSFAYVNIHSFGSYALLERVARRKIFPTVETVQIHSQTSLRDSQHQK